MTLQTEELAGWKILAGWASSTDLDELVAGALLSERFGPEAPTGVNWVVAVIEPEAQRPSLVVIQRFYAFQVEFGFNHGELLVPESHVLFLGAGNRALAYVRCPEGWSRLWERRTPWSFWGVGRHGDVVLIASEIALEAFALDGTFLWDSSADPPWEYDVDGEKVTLTEFSRTGEFPLHSGPHPGEPAYRPLTGPWPVPPAPRAPRSRLQRFVDWLRDSGQFGR